MSNICKICWSEFIGKDEYCLKTSMCRKCRQDERSKHREEVEKTKDELKRAFIEHLTKNPDEAIKYLADVIFDEKNEFEINQIKERLGNV